jgi:hypothetical protein
MQIRVLIERLAWNSYRVTGEGLFAFSVEGESREKALALFKEQVQERLIGKELLTLEIPDNPWLQMAGIFKDDPDFEEWQEAMKEYRRQVDEDPNAL